MYAPRPACNPSPWTARCRVLRRGPATGCYAEGPLPGVTPRASYRVLRRGPATGCCAEGPLPGVTPRARYRVLRRGPNTGCYAEGPLPGVAPRARYRVLRRGPATGCCAEGPLPAGTPWALPPAGATQPQASPGLPLGGQARPDALCPALPGPGTWEYCVHDG
eukprot:11095-Chlamydomonas_euryale.AAC.1